MSYPTDDQQMDNAHLAKDDPFYMPKEGLSWYDSSGRLRWFLAWVGRDSYSIEDTITINRDMFPDLYENI